MPKYIQRRVGAKTFVVLLSILLFLLVFSSTVSAKTLGNVSEDPDGDIDVNDVVLVVKHILGIADPELTDNQLIVADVNGDGEVNVKDANLIMQRVLNLIDEFPFTLYKVESVSDIDDISVVLETSFDDIGLPETVDVTLDDDSDLEVDVDWSDAEDDYDASETGTYELSGELVNLPFKLKDYRVINPEGLTADVNVIVGEDVLEVVGLSAINSKTIGVEFNRAPTEDEADDVKFKVIKLTTSATIPTVATWDGNVAKLTRLTDLSYTASTYVVEVTGIETAFSGTVIITEPTPTSLEINAVSIPDDTERAPLRVRLLDQYGEDMELHPGQFTWTAINLRSSQDVTNRISYHPVAKFVINTKTWWPGVFQLGDEIQITFAHTPSDLSKTVILPVTYKTQLDSIVFGDIILPGDATHLTKDLQNVRIPVTAKDQYTNMMFLVDGANVELYSSDQLKVKDENLSFVTIDDQQYINIAKFEDKGSVTVTVMGTPGIVGSKTINILESVPYELKVVTEPDPAIVEGKSTEVRFDVLDQFGNRITSDRDFYEMIVVKTSGDDVKIVDPGHLDDYTISQAIVDIPIEAGTTLMPPYNETITFRLQKTDNTYVDSKTFSINVIADIDDLDITVDKSEYTAGDTIEVTIKGTVGGNVHTDYNLSGQAKITLEGPEDLLYYRTLTFTNGIATTTVPAKVAGDDYNVRVEYDHLDVTEADLFDIKAGPASKFTLEGDTTAATLDVALTDDYKNPIETFESDKLLRLTYPDAATKPAGISDEGDLEVSFTAGEAKITFGADLVPGTYTVTFEEYTGSLTIPSP